MSIEEKLALSKMESIQHIFRQAQTLFSDTTDWINLYPQLNDFDIEFRSIAYEAAAMAIALNDFKVGDKPDDWFRFLQGPAVAHAIQVHVGLGWAIAQEQIDPLIYLSMLEPMKRYRVMDGYGYYEGIFRRRKSVNLHQQPSVADAVALSAYDQGLGRSIWYTSKADINLANTTIESFAVERHKDLWRGLGIACTYVGGCTEAMLNELMVSAAEYKTQLAAGAVMAAISRQKAGYMTPDAELTCNIWCKKTAVELARIYKPTEPELGPEVANAYSLWISKIESVF